MKDEFAQQVRGILDHLYDYEYLQESPLAHALDPDGQAMERERMRRLRSTVLASLEELNPGSQVSPYSPRVRSYQVLNLHYVDRLTVQQVASELALSERQVYRDLRQAEMDLAEALWIKFPRAAPSDASAAGTSRLDLALRELSRLPAEQHMLDVWALLEGATSAVRRLAEQRGTAIEMPAGVPHSLGTIRGDRHTARQVLVGILSFVVQHAKPSTAIRIGGKQVGDSVSLEYRFSPIAMDLAIPEVTLGLAERLGGKIGLESIGSDRAVLALALSDQRPYHVLVIDDNEGLIALFQRYLTGEQYRVTGAKDGVDGLRKAEDLTPNVIVLDVLMPGQDGWEILERLRENELTQSIPVIVCSVLDSPVLARSLGAAGVLSKPVSRQRLLQELSRCCPPSSG